MMTTMTDAPPPRDVHRLGHEYLELLLEGQRHAALKKILDQVDAGLPVSTVYVDVLQPIMYELGRLWQVDEIDVATEHYVTAATQLLMAKLFPHILNQRRLSRSMIGCCLGSELHELGMRMVCDFFEFEGWDTYFLGAITPSDNLVSLIRSRQPDLLCLSATMSFGLPQIRDLIRAVHAIPAIKPPRIMVGGLPFIINPELSSKVGADATASDARLAVKAAAELFLPETTHAATR
jgi:methanogenic corrinoid protein MtbC1